MRSSLICLICSLWCFSAWAVAPKFCGSFEQGQIIRGYAKGFDTVEIGGKVFPVAEDGQFILALGRDAEPEIEIILKGKMGSEIYHFNVAPVKWHTQSINGVPPRKVTPSKADEVEIIREQQEVRRALASMDTQRQDWRKGFIMPVQGRVSGSFGNQRIFNGVPKSPHSGMDIAVAQGTPIKASGDGKVLLGGGNYFYGGNMVIIDHGMGLQTIYMHLQEAKVKAGDNVKQGEIIGLAGKTGRATGPHLHWGASLNNIRVKPQALLDLAGQTCETGKADK